MGCAEYCLKSYDAFERQSSSRSLVELSYRVTQQLDWLTSLCLGNRRVDSAAIPLLKLTQPCFPSAGSRQAPPPPPPPRRVVVHVINFWDLLSLWVGPAEQASVRVPQSVRTARPRFPPSLYIVGTLTVASSALLSFSFFAAPFRRDRPVESTRHCICSTDAIGVRVGCKELVLRAGGRGAHKAA